MANTNFTLKSIWKYLLIKVITFEPRTNGLRNDLLKIF